MLSFNPHQTQLSTTLLAGQTQRERITRRKLQMGQRKMHQCRGDILLRASCVRLCVCCCVGVVVVRDDTKEDIAQTLALPNPSCWKPQKLKHTYLMHIWFGVGSFETKHAVFSNIRSIKQFWGNLRSWTVPPSSFGPDIAPNQMPSRRFSGSAFPAGITRVCLATMIGLIGSKPLKNSYTQR